MYQYTQTLFFLKHTYTRHRLAYTHSLFRSYIRSLVHLYLNNNDDNGQMALPIMYFACNHDAILLLRFKMTINTNENQTLAYTFSVLPVFFFLCVSKKSHIWTPSYLCLIVCMYMCACVCGCGCVSNNRLSLFVWHIVNNAMFLQHLLNLHIYVCPATIITTTTLSCGIKHMMVFKRQQK